MKKISLMTAVALMGVASVAFASGGSQHPPKQMVWKFDGVLGTVDRQSAQRGLQVYKEVCAACHSLNLVAFRTLTDLGLSEAEVKALAATYTVKDGPNDEGEMFDRSGLPSDKFVSPYANEQAARAANNGAFPPDLSLMIKARPNGANYVYSLLTGYGDVPAGFHLNEGMNYNPYFPNMQIAMPAPLSEGGVTYEDGTKATVEQMAKDVVNFLQWTAEPEMEQRKSLGLRVMMYLGIMTVFFLIAKRRLWKNMH